MNIVKISEIVEVFREAILSVSKNEFVTSLSKIGFPRGCCDDASQLLAAFLTDNGFEGSLRVNGRNGGGKGELGSHIWLLYSGLTIDITADQFKKYNEAPVIVSAESKFHKLFNFEVKGLADFRVRFANDEAWLSRFSRDYEKVLNRVNV